MYLFHLKRKSDYTNLSRDIRPLVLIITCYYISKKDLFFLSLFLILKERTVVKELITAELIIVQLCL